MFKLLVLFVLMLNFYDVMPADFVYKLGKCEVQKATLPLEMLRLELRSILNPTIRFLGTQRIHYDLYTSLNPNRRQILAAGDMESLKKSNFNSKWPVRILIHGWTGKSITCSNAALKDAYLQKGNFNVIIMDWSDISHDISYPRVSQQFPHLAQHLLKFIKFLQRQTQLDLKQIYLIGHSAGAHISGFVGKYLGPQRLGAIIALDPAGLAQLNQPAENRLAPTDAEYVESIHTDLTLLGNPSFELSHASFFVNWAQGQPHCPNATTAELDFACDHYSAMYYFVESIRNPRLFGAVQLKKPSCLRHYNCTCPADSEDLQQCEATAYMGGEPVRPKKGIFYLSTKSEAPFGRGNVVKVRKVLIPHLPKTPYISAQLHQISKMLSGVVRR